MSEDRRESFYHERLKVSRPQYDGFDELSVQIFVELLYTYDVFHQLSTRYMADFGLSKSSFNILMLLRNGPAKGMQLHELGELLLVSRANITGLIDSLLEKGWVTRVVDEEDRRVRYAQITEKAESLLNEFLPVHYRQVKTLFQELSCEEKESLSALLKKARHSMTAKSGHAMFCDAPNS